MNADLLNRAAARVMAHPKAALVAQVLLRAGVEGLSNLPSTNHITSWSVPTDLRDEAREVLTFCAEILDMTKPSVEWVHRVIESGDTFSLQMERRP